MCLKRMERNNRVSYFAFSVADGPQVSEEQNMIRGLFEQIFQPKANPMLGQSQ